MGERPDRALKEVLGVSSRVPVFDEDLLKGLVWASRRYVAPLSVVLSMASPPNLPRRAPRPAAPPPLVGSDHPLAKLAEAAAAGRRRPTQALVGRWQDLGWVGALTPVIGAGRSALIVAATAAEASGLADAAGATYGEAVVAVCGDNGAELTAAWEKAQSGGRLVVGTPRAATWRVRRLALALCLEEGRRAMKIRSPAIHVRDLLRTRSKLERFTSVFYGPTPSLEILSAGAEAVRVGARAWPLVEIVDRSGEAPGSGLLAPSVEAALRSMTARGERSFVLTGVKMIDRMSAEVGARLGAAAVGSDRPVIVGAERDMVDAGPMALTVASNADGMLMGVSYRAREETLRVLARLANLLGQASGRRMMVQTANPGSDLAETLRKGDPMPYLERELVERARTGAPPSTEMLVVEIRGRRPPGVSAALEGMPGAEVVGPLEIDQGLRWLLQGDLRRARVALRELVGRWRGAETAVRVDADPIDL